MLWHKDEESDVMVPDALYSEPGRRSTEGGEEEEVEVVVGADREEERMETV